MIFYFFQLQSKAGIKKKDEEGLEIKLLWYNTIMK